MILVYPERPLSVAASSADGAFPVTNLQNSKPKKIWKAQSTSATITATVPAYSDSIGLFNTNAASATITIKIGAATQESFSVDLTSPHTHNRLWQSYTEITVEHTVVIVLATGSSDVVYGGVLIIGKGVSIADPDYGLTEGREDPSIIRKLNNGAYYIRKRDAQRVFSLTFMQNRASGYYDFTNVADYYGPKPLAILLSENMSDSHEWAIYGHLLSPFNSNHAFYNHNQVSYTITEAA